MEIIGLYRCLNCGEEANVIEEVKIKQIFKKVSDPSITSVNFPLDPYVAMSSVVYPRFEVETQNQGLTSFHPFITHKCKYNIDSWGVMQLVKIHNSGVEFEDENT